MLRCSREIAKSMSPRSIRRAAERKQRNLLNQRNRALAMAALPDEAALLSEPKIQENEAALLSEPKTQENDSAERQAQKLARKAAQPAITAAAPASAQTAPATAAPQHGASIPKLSDRIHAA